MMTDIEKCTAAARFMAGWKDQAIKGRRQAFTGAIGNADKIRKTT